MAVYRKCKTCGAEFKVSKDRRFYCCNECKYVQRRYQNKQKKKKAKSNFDDFVEIETKSLGMLIDYGEYVRKYDRPKDEAEKLKKYYEEIGVKPWKK